MKKRKQIIYVSEITLSYSSRGRHNSASKEYSKTSILLNSDLVNKIRDESNRYSCYSGKHNVPYLAGDLMAAILYNIPFTEPILSKKAWTPIWRMADQKVGLEAWLFHIYKAYLEPLNIQMEGMIDFRNSIDEEERLPYVIVEDWDIDCY